MSTSSTKMPFQAEVAQLLHLVTHSLYSNREIFLRELISNASDACDKLRFEAVGYPDLTSDDPELRIQITWDPEARTVSVRDNGIGIAADRIDAASGGELQPADTNANASGQAQNRRTELVALSR